MLSAQNQHSEICKRNCNNCFADSFCLVNFDVSVFEVALVKIRLWFFLFFFFFGIRQFFLCLIEYCSPPLTWQLSSSLVPIWNGPRYPLTASPDSARRITGLEGRTGREEEENWRIFSSQKLFFSFFGRRQKVELCARSRRRIGCWVPFKDTRTHTQPGRRGGEFDFSLIEP